jgi:hypothetical protein
VADLIRTLEADLFGGYEWAAEFYADFVDVPEAPDRLAAYRGLMRAFEALEGKAEEAMRAAEGLVQAEDDLDDVERALLAPLEAPRDAFFADPGPPTARVFLAAFEPAWEKGPQQALVADVILAALAESNVIASHERKTRPPEEQRALHARAARRYEQVNALLQFRVGSGSLAWSETAQSALFRASAAWRLAGDEERAKRATRIAGAPPGADDLLGRGLTR